MLAKPAIVSKPSPNRGYKNGFTHRPEAIVWHITEGTEASALSWLTNPNSSASANYVIGRDGTIYELVPPDQSAWANGRVQNPNTSNPLITRWLAEGVNLNQRTISIEHAGYSSQNKGGSLTDKQIASTCLLTAWLCQQYHLTPDRTHILGHCEIDSIDRPYCPGFSQAEWFLWVGNIQALVAGSAPAPTPTPDPAKVTARINAQGEAEIVLNFGGSRIKTIEGYIVVDAGVTIINEDNQRLSRSIKMPEGFLPWHN